MSKPRELFRPFVSFCRSGRSCRDRDPSELDLDELCPTFILSARQNPGPPKKSSCRNFWKRAPE
jgi:hypothetical protein